MGGRGPPPSEPPPETWRAVIENGLKAEWSFLESGLEEEEAELEEEEVER